MRYIQLYNSTPLAQSLLDYKGLPYKVVAGECPAFPDHDGPVIQDGDHWIAGTYPLLGYLDRRVIYPAFFPAEQDAYAKASMCFDLFLREYPDPKDWLPIVANCTFVLGRHPCIVDLVLSSVPHSSDIWKDYQSRVHAAHGATILDNAA